MKKKKWAVEGDKRVGWVADFIRKYLKLDPADNLVSLSCVVSVGKYTEGGKCEKEVEK